VTCSFSPAHTELLQGRAVPTGTGMGSVSTGREESRGQRNKTQQGQLQVAEKWVGKEGNANGNSVAGETWAPPGHALQGRLLPRVTHLQSPLPPSTTFSPWGLG